MLTFASNCTIVTHLPSESKIIMKIDHKKDKELLINLSKALNISLTHIRKDELNYWNIIGKETFIDTDGEYWYIHIFSTSERKWNACKKSLEWMELRNDGD